MEPRRETPDGRDLLELSDAELIAQCGVDTFRGSGPGGQKRNKTESAVRLRHLPTGLSATSDETRSQHLNRRRALGLLRLHLALELRRPIELEGYRPPPALAQLINTGGRGQRRGSAPELLALASLCDLFAAAGGSVSETAARLGIGTAAASKLLLLDEKFARRMNALRSERGLRPLR